VRDASLPAAATERRRWLHRLGDLWPSAAVLAGSRLSDDDPALADWQSAVRSLTAALSADARRILDPPRLLTGQEVQTLLRVAPGPQVGEALGAIQQAQVDGEIATRQEAEALLKRRFGETS